ncbi:MAG: thymidine phosphorylase [Calditrichaeota bacterium]|nr:MAG: thymidine phosphorylase [Calditrichota bacterium]
MTAQEIITRKRDGAKLSEEEIDYIIGGYTAGKIPDYQIAAFLMAVYFQSMDAEETATFTRLMRDSGDVMQLGEFPMPKVDKHSTGGVGDKVSIILAPLVAACGVMNPMISGRSLGHTGGTLDKLESIPGFNTQIPMEEFLQILSRYNFALIGQTPEICPADKKMYALRDATATVSSIPLICGSILSKKLAEDLDVLVLDVKCGNGAIFEKKEDARKLAKALVQTAGVFDLKTVAILTQMDQPLGNAIGNWFETEEAIRMLHGQAPEDLHFLTIELSAYMVWLAGKESSLEKARTLVSSQLKSGEALKRFREIVIAQGGDVAFVDDPDSFAKPQFKAEIIASQSGYVAEAHARKLGQISMLLGAGRQKKEDSVDVLAGIKLHKKVGEIVEKGSPLCTLFANLKPIPETLIHRADSAFKITGEKVAKLPLILDIIE